MSCSYVIIPTTCWGSLDGLMGIVSIPYFETWDYDKLNLEQEKYLDIGEARLERPYLSKCTCSQRAFCCDQVGHLLNTLILQIVISFLC